jgi:hypothetical protein
MKNASIPVMRKDDLVIQELDGEILIYDLRNDKALCLNSTSALIWQACDGSKSVSEISEFVGKKLDSTSSEDLVWLALDQLKKEKLIENGSAIDNSHFEGMSRRQVIRKIGLSSLVAIPVVSSLVAPVAAGTASGVCFGTLGMSCNCFDPVCNMNNDEGDPAPSTTCASATCTAGPATPACICVGPFTCNPNITNGDPSTHFKIGTCGT